MLGSRVILCLVAVGLWGGALLHGQVPADLQQAIRERQEAVAKADAAGWGRLTTDDFTVVSADGTLMTKAERLADIGRQKPQAVSTPQHHEIKMYGDAAVERFRTADSYWVLVVWVKQSHGWRAAAAQITATQSK
jgi:Domain of unknown function (DUF4440)